MTLTRLDNYMAHWIAEDFWQCDNHLPGARIPAKFEKCWYSCGSVRPPRPVGGVQVKEPAPRKVPPFTVRVLETPAPTPPPSIPLKAAPKPTVVVEKLPKPSIDVVPSKPKVVVPLKGLGTSSEGPTPQEIRRGATTRVQCVSCGTTLWRRKREVAERATFSCAACRGRGQ